MKTKNLLVLIFTLTLCFSLIMPMNVSAKGENDFTASLSVSDTSVPTGTQVTCSITVKNTDPTWGCDTSVSTASGVLVDSFYLAAGASKTVTHNVTINSSQKIYYKVYASHGPDISKTKNTNTVTVESNDPPDDPPQGNNDPPQGNDDPPQGNDDPTPNEEIIIETPEIETEPIHGVPKSGSLFIASIENVTFDGMPIEGSCEVMRPHDYPVIMTGEIHYHLPDSITADYLSREEDEYCYILANWRMCAPSTDAMEEIGEMFVLTTDDGVITFTQEIVLDDIPLLYDDLMDSLIFDINLIDPTDGNRYHEYISIGLIPGPEIDDSYMISLDELYFNGEIIADPSAVIRVGYGTPFTITQNLSYTVSLEELTLPDFIRTRIDVLTYIDGDYPTVIRASNTSFIPETASGDLAFEIVADRASYAPTCLDYGIHTIQITARHERDVLPIIDCSETVMLTIEVVDSDDVDSDDTEEDELTIFDGTFFMDVPGWLGLGNSIEMELDREELTGYGDTDVFIAGTASYRASEEFYIRISGDGFMREHYPAGYIPEGTIRYENTEFIDETTTFEILTELIAVDDGEILASDVDYLTATVLHREERTDYRQRFSLMGEPLVIGLGEDVTFNYHLSNEVTGESVHVQLVDNDTGALIFEDTDFEPLELMESSFTRSPRINEYYSFTARVLDDAGVILWEELRDAYVVVMPNHSDGGEISVFDLNLGANSLEIEEGETVRIYGAIDYGSVDHHLALGDIDIVVEDQEGHVLHFDSGVMPRDLVGFFEDYILTETTEFTITATGTDTDTGTVFTDTDTIEITVIEGGGIIDDVSLFSLDYDLYTGPRIISSGDSVDFLARIENNSTENLNVVVFKDDGTFLGGAVEYLLPGEVMSAFETMTFTESQTLSFRAVAWASGDVVVFTETIYRTVLVDPELAEGAEAAPEGEYAIDLVVAASEESIVAGDIVELYVDAENAGMSDAEIVLSFSDGYIIETGTNTSPGDTISHVLLRTPPETVLYTVEARALDDDGLVQYIATQSVVVTVIEPVPMPSDAEAHIDIDITPFTAAVESGEGIDFDITVENTGEVDFAHYVVSESLSASSRRGAGLLSGEAETFTVNQSFTRDTSIVFDVRGYADDGTLLATDSQAVTVEIMAPLPDAPLLEDLSPMPYAELPSWPFADMIFDEETEEDSSSDAPEDDSSSRVPEEDSSSDASEDDSSSSVPEDDTPADSAPSEDSGVTADEPSDTDTFAGGIALSLTPIEDKNDGGRLVIISPSEDVQQRTQRVYMARRVMAILIGAMIILFVALIGVLIRNASMRKSQK